MASIEILGDEAPFKQSFSVTPARHVKLGPMFLLFAWIRFYAFATKCCYTIYHITLQQDYYHRIRGIIIVVNISNLTSIVITAIGHWSR